MYFGWLNRPEETDRVLKTLPMPSFEEAAGHLKSDDSDALLYEIFRKIVGQDMAKGPQGIGDCVSWGWSGGVDFIQAIEISRGTLESFKWTASEAVYALSRVEVGGERGSYEDGSVGAWAAEAVSKWGTLSRDVVGEYDKNRAKEWGAKGLSKDLEDKARDHLVKTVSMVKTANGAKTAIQNLYPVMVCSNVGFTMTRDKQGFCRPSGRWDHCMKFIAYRGSSRPGLLCAQSWGANTPDGPLDLNQPDNTFWVDMDVADRMLSQGDSFTASQFNGYPDQDSTNWSF